MSAAVTPVTSAQQAEAVLMDLTVFIVKDGSELVTDSRAVAIAFRKKHKNVLRAIDSMLHSTRPLIAEHYRLNFEPVTYLDTKGERRPMFRMTRKGLSELAMGFSGDDAREVRIRFLNAFEEMAERLARAERSIIERIHALDRRELPSIVKGKIDSALMHERRREKPDLDAERAALQELAQPDMIKQLEASPA